MNTYDRYHWALDYIHGSLNPCSWRQVKKFGLDHGYSIKGVEGYLYQQVTNGALKAKAVKRKINIHSVEAFYNPYLNPGSWIIFFIRCRRRARLELILKEGYRGRYGREWVLAELDNLMQSKRVAKVRQLSEIIYVWRR